MPLAQVGPVNRAASSFWTSLAFGNRPNDRLEKSGSPFRVTSKTPPVLGSSRIPPGSDGWNSSSSFSANLAALATYPQVVQYSIWMALPVLDGDDDTDMWTLLPCYLARRASIG